MQVPEFLRHIWAWIKNGFEALNKKLIPIANAAVTVTNALKVIMDSGAVNVITEITPTTVDDKIAAAIRDALPKVLGTMTIIRDIAVNNDSPEEALQVMLDRIKELMPDSQAFQWLEFSSKMTKELSAALEDGDISITEAINLSHDIYNAVHKNAA